MAITYPLSLPSTDFQQITLRPMSTTGVSVSPYTGKHQVYKYAAQAWMMDVVLPPMKRTDAEDWIAFLLALQGRYGTFTMGDPSGSSPRGSVPGTPVVNGASQTGSELITDGWTPSQSGILLAGDYIQFGTELHRITQDVDSDVGGNATLDIWPDIRTSPGDGASITTSNTTGLWRLFSDQPQWQLQGCPVYSLAFTAIEAF